MHTRQEILKALHRQIEKNGHLIGVAAGCGMTARSAIAGGADFVLALSAGRFRQVGYCSLASLLCYTNSNALVMDFGSRELLPAVPGTPVIFGLNATDPTIHLYEYLHTVKDAGFSGINNFPTMGLIDGKFAESLREEGFDFEREVEAIALAHFMDLFTVAFVFNTEQARAMVSAGADVICTHLGLTQGGRTGAKTRFSMQEAIEKTEDIMGLCETLSPGIIQMVYGGPIGRPEDFAGFYTNPLCRGYIGGSAFERIPVERAVIEITRRFKDSSWGKPESAPVVPQRADVADVAKDYVQKHYAESLTLAHVADIVHVSASYLGAKFRRDVGASFTEYLVKRRLDAACELLARTDEKILAVSLSVGYRDYAQFSKMFKKLIGLSPSAYREKMRRGVKREKNA